ncbi:glucose/arabinose dehydrogenase [Chitinophaga skermanii]|uniref:Glucose/arabinose dehydrogenase n=1 Tax=Chitinophaga skermanii TaxID=331697 RepID=A0A327Q9C4_9BACT|nr:PQQ-dependent sugar dehydrogenase [Chitinophaga skermanii]RAJ00292.1 glucose/arabinose dehydrogenase [Chitinophaga skermanii]
MYLIRLIGMSLLSVMGNTGCNNAPASNPADSTKTSAAEAPAAATTVKLQLVTDHFISPVAMATPGDGSNRLFICQKEGKVWIIENGKLVPTPFLDVAADMVKINEAYDERGLLGIAFHPQYKSNGKFYVYYSAPSTTKGSNHRSVVAEYKVSNNKNVANKASKREVLTFEQPESNHNGGDIIFGKDGYLYIASGDGGGGGDKHGSIGNGQNMNTLLGKILRIDVNSGSPYSVPSSNPFVNQANVRPEIWAYGLRNPWRISFDKPTGRLFTGDVGQNQYEEVDIITKGGNYGWRIMEGYHEFNVPNGADKSKLIEPIHEYDHKTGISITGGYIYRGKAIPALTGKYVFGDYNGKTWTLTQSGNKWTRDDLNFQNKPNTNLAVLSFGEDEQGEIYVLTSSSDSKGFKGAVYKLVPAT